MGPELKTGIWDVNPKAVETQELYGYISMATREWKDGLLSTVMRNIGAIPDELPKWIMLDGDLDANWIESMNSVMDDNRMLTLASDSVLKLTLNLTSGRWRLRETTSTPSTWPSESLHVSRMYRDSSVTASFYTGRGRLHDDQRDPADLVVSGAVVHSLRRSEAGVARRCGAIRGHRCRNQRHPHQFVGYP